MECDDDDAAFQCRFVEGSAYDREAKQHAVAEEAGKPDYHGVFPRSAEKKPRAEYPHEEDDQATRVERDQHEDVEAGSQIHLRYGSEEQAGDGDALRETHQAVRLFGGQQFAPNDRIAESDNQKYRNRYFKDNLQFTDLSK